MNNKFWNKVVKAKNDYLHSFLDGVYDAFENSFFFTDIIKYREWLLKYHDNLVELQNAGADKFSLQEEVTKEIKN